MYKKYEKEFNVNPNPIENPILSLPTAIFSCSHLQNRPWIFLIFIQVGLFCLYITLICDNSFQIGTLVLLILFGSPLAIIDSLYYLLPNSLVLLFLSAAWLLCVNYSPYALSWHIFSGLSIFLLLFCLQAVHTEGLGGGDVKLMSVLAFLLGLQASLLTLFIASILALLHYYLFVRNASSQIPFGPFLLVAAYLSVLS